MPTEPTDEVRTQITKIVTEYGHGCACGLLIVLANMDIDNQVANPRKQGRLSGIEEEWLL